MVKLSSKLFNMEKIALFFVILFMSINIGFSFNAKSITSSPTLDIFLISVILSLITSLITKYTTPQEEIKVLKRDQRRLQKLLKEHLKKQEMEKVKSIQSEIMSLNLELMKRNMNLKSMLFTTIPFFIVFPLLSKYYSPFGKILNIGFLSFGWFGTYILFSLVSSIFWRKVLKLE